MTLDQISVVSVAHDTYPDDNKHEEEERHAPARVVRYLLGVFLHVIYLVLRALLGLVDGPLHLAVELLLEVGDAALHLGLHSGQYGGFKELHAVLDHVLLLLELRYGVLQLLVDARELVLQVVNEHLELVGGLVRFVLLNGVDLGLRVRGVDLKCNDVMVVGKSSSCSGDAKARTREEVLGELLLEASNSCASLPVVLALAIDFNDDAVLVVEQADTGKVEGGEVVPALMVPKALDVAAEDLLGSNLGLRRAVVDEKGDVPVLLAVLDVLEGVDDDGDALKLGVHAVEAALSWARRRGQPHADAVAEELAALP
mmetsp:Transcript_4153/g.7866  ORF Transcript_4153/g.7866 Transcript_4153/m.7866 type:complete len:313 (+) Transcript_4153:61-999(+)